MKITHLNKAFTMAEVLITIGIIGVVAAMTLPTVMNKTKHRELQTAFKKTYSELNQASQLFMVKEGMSFSEYSVLNRSLTHPELMKKFMGYFKGVSNYNKGLWNNQDDDTIVRPYKIKSLNGKKTTEGICDVTGRYADIAGRVYSLNDAPLTTGVNGPIICVDTNGQKGPNRYGYDYFLFVFTTDGYVIPMGQNHKNNTSSIGEDSNGSSLAKNGFVTGEEYCNYTESTLKGGYSCAYYAMQDKRPDEKGDYWNDFLD